MLRTTLAELHTFTGSVLGVSAWVSVDQGRIDGFAEATEDRQWIHVDQERSAKGPFGMTIAHGYLTLSLVSGFLFEVLTVTDASSVVNYGLDRVRFPSPVPVATSLRGQVELVSVTHIAGGCQATTRVTVEKVGGGKPACVAEVLTRFLR